MNMNDSSDSLAYRQLVKPRLAESLATMGLDVIYHRAKGDYVYMHDQSGEEIEVLDMVGGNGGRPSRTGWSCMRSSRSGERRGSSPRRW